MDRSNRGRLTILFCALGATVVAIAYPLEDAVDVVEIAEFAARDTNAPASSPALVAESGPAWIASEEDPFAVRSWQPPTVVQVPVNQVAPVEAAPPPPPPPPPLPYKFVGQMANGADRVIYLSRGDQVLLAHQGDVLEGTYKVVSIGGNQIEFETLSSGLKQALAIPAQEQ